MADVNLNDMIGVRKNDKGNREDPKATIAGRRYNLPAVTRVRLGDNHFCILDRTLDADAVEKRIAELKKLVAKSSSTRKSVKVSDES